MRIARALAVAAGAAGLSLAAIELLAAINVRRERKRRIRPDGSLHLERLGTGTPIVFLAGLDGTTHWWGDSFAPLSRSHELLFIDALGFGQSPWPRVAYTLDDHLAALRSTLEGTGATRGVRIVAHSFGTILAAYYAAAHPDEVTSLTLLGTPLFESEREAREGIEAMSHMAALFSLTPLLAREGCMINCAFRPIFRALAPLARPDLPPEVARDVVLHYWDSFNGTLRNVLLGRPASIPLRKIGRKVTFIHGLADTITPAGRVESFAAEIGARVIVTGNGHQGYLTESIATLLQVVGGK